MNFRRLRSNQHIRELAATVTVHHKEFIQPLFVDETLREREPVRHLNEVFSDTTDSIFAQVEADIAAGVTKFLLFPVPAEKFEQNFRFDFASDVVQSLKERFGADIWLANDLCLCSYTAHGHCGLLNAEGTRLLNDDTVQLLADYALHLAQAGADCIAPSDMTDGRIHAIRQKLDTHNLDHVAVMSYSSKFSSKFYGPFRDVCKSSPSAQIQLSGRSTYQISPDNLNDALASTLRDIEEGADIVMVKPALPYLDIVTRLGDQILTPIAVYHVSGEYAAVELMAENDIIERDAAHLELWTSFKRAGASIIISYAARHAKAWIHAV